MPKTSRRLTVHPLALREVEVVRVMDLTPGIRLVFCHPGRTEPVPLSQSFGMGEGPVVSNPADVERATSVRYQSDVERHH